MEPVLLSNGKRFHRLVQQAWAGTIENSRVKPEHGIHLSTLCHTAGPQRKGRIDIFVDQIEDFVTVIEIKSTDWDRIQPQNRKNLLVSHCRQVFRYIDKYLDVDKLNVCAAIIYPRYPVTPGLKVEIEDYLNQNSLQVIWYDDK